jgi:hypothetical protein
MGRFIITAGTVITLAYQIAKAINAIRLAMLAANTAFLTSPIGMATMAIAAAIGLLYYLVMQKRSSPTLFEFFTMLPKMFIDMATAGLKFSSSILVLAAALPMLSVGLLGLALGFSAFANPLTLAGLVAFSFALGKVVEQINNLETDKIINFKTIMEKSVEIAEPSNIKGFEQFSEKFEAVAKATANVDASKTQTFTNLLTATQNLSQALKVNNTVVVKIGDKKFEAVIEETINKVMGDQTISRPVGG